MVKEDYSIRAIKRGLIVLQAINRSGSLRLMDMRITPPSPTRPVARVTAKPSRAAAALDNLLAEMTPKWRSLSSLKWLW